MSDVELLENLIQHFKETPDDRAVWMALSDALLDVGTPAMYLAVQRGVYRHTIVMLSGRLDEAMLAGVKSIEEEYDHHHDIEIIQVLPGEYIRAESEEHAICSLQYVWNTPGGRKPGLLPNLRKDCGGKVRVKVNSSLGVMPAAEEL
jgi:hypothetical protein